jgi:putative phosphoribosyl transferase
MLFRDRRDAGRKLARAMRAYGSDDVIVLALPRGGVPVAYEVARAIDAPLDVFLVRKLGAPGQPELAMGAIASGGIVFVNSDVMQAMDLPPQAIESAAAREQIELARRERVYRGQRPYPRLEGRTVILVDDGLATGSSMRAAARAVAAQKPRKIVVAVPVAAPSTCAELAREVHEVVCPYTPVDFSAVGHWYDNFTQTEDEEVQQLLRQAAEERQNPAVERDGP